jgi:hypothetical protein
VVIAANNYFRYGTECIQCNESVIAPNWSKYVSEHHVRHSWSCENCGYQFETSDHLRFNTPSKAHWKAAYLPLLVA